MCPTDHLRTQWASAAEQFGIALDPSLPNSVGPIGPDYQGAVFTYAQVAGHPMLHRNRAERSPSLVILDEIHHAGDGLSWGDAVREAYDPAKFRLSLTGTPFRTSATERIPFVTYTEVGGGQVESTADYHYGYREALEGPRRATGHVRRVLGRGAVEELRGRRAVGEPVRPGDQGPGDGRVADRPGPERQVGPARRSPPPTPGSPRSVPPGCPTPAR